MITRFCQRGNMAAATPYAYLVRFAGCIRDELHARTRAYVIQRTSCEQPRERVCDIYIDHEFCFCLEQLCEYAHVYAYVYVHACILIPFLNYRTCTYQLQCIYIYARMKCIYKMRMCKHLYTYVNAYCTDDRYYEDLHVNFQFEDA